MNKNKHKASSIQDQMITVMVPLNSNNNMVNGGNDNGSSGQQQQQAALNQKNNNKKSNQQQATATSTTQTPVAMMNASPMNGINNVSKTIITSSESSEQSLDKSGLRVDKSNIKKITNQLKPDADNGSGQLQVPQQQQQKTIFLKFPQNLLDSEQLIVSSEIIFGIYP